MFIDVGFNSVVAVETNLRCAEIVLIRCEVRLGDHSHEAAIEVVTAAAATKLVEFYTTAATACCDGATDAYADLIVENRGSISRVILLELMEFTWRQRLMLRAHISSANYRKTSTVTTLIFLSNTTLHLQVEIIHLTHIR